MQGNGTHLPDERGLMVPRGPRAFSLAPFANLTIQTSTDVPMSSAVVSYPAHAQAITQAMEPIQFDQSYSGFFPDVHTLLHKYNISNTDYTKLKLAIRTNLTHAVNTGTARTESLVRGYESTCREQAKLIGKKELQQGEPTVRSSARVEALQAKVGLAEHKYKSLHGTWQREIKEAEARQARDRNRLRACAEEKVKSASKVKQLEAKIRDLVLEKEAAFHEGQRFQTNLRAGAKELEPSSTRLVEALPESVAVSALHKDGESRMIAEYNARLIAREEVVQDQANKLELAEQRFAEFLARETMQQEHAGQMKLLMAAKDAKIDELSKALARFQTPADELVFKQECDDFA